MSPKPLKIVMSLNYKYRKARQVIDSFNDQDMAKLIVACADLRRTEARFLKKARPLLKKCVYGCEGICCRNIHVDEIISLWDLIFILVSEKDAGKKIRQSLENETRLFTSDCIFLENGVGPCIFPFDCRPEICITTFCTGTSSIRKEISRLKIKFFKLMWFIRLTRCRSAFMKLFGKMQ